MVLFTVVFIITNVFMGGNSEENNFAGSDVIRNVVKCVKKS